MNYLVNMSRWDYEAMRTLLEQFSSGMDPDDPREIKRLLIIGAATELFIQQGYRKTTIAEVADRAGVAKGTVYLYARNKADLLVQAIVEEKKHYIRLMKPILAPDLSPRLRLKRWLQTALVFSQEMPLVSRLMGGDREILLAIQEMDQDVRDRSLSFQHDFLGQMLDEAARPHRWTESELADRVQVLLGLMYSSHLLADERVRGGLALERFAEILAEMIVDGAAGGAPATGQQSETTGGAS